MTHSIILFSSLTWALRAQKVLEQRGIRSYLKKVSGNKKLGGCGYGLELTGGRSEAISALSSAGVRIVDVL